MNKYPFIRNHAFLATIKQPIEYCYLNSISQCFSAYLPKSYEWTIIETTDHKMLNNEGLTAHIYQQIDEIFENVKCFLLGKRLRENLSDLGFQDAFKTKLRTGYQKTPDISLLSFKIILYY